MVLGTLLRFGLIGTGILAVLPVVFVAKYVFSRPLSRLTITSRPLNSVEESRIQQGYDAAGLPAVDTVVATGIEKHVAGLSGTPGQRVVVISEPLLEAMTDDELKGLAGILAGQHEEQYLEVYSGVLFATSAVLAIALGIDPSGFRSTLIPMLLLLVLLPIPIAGFWFLRRTAFAADARAVNRVGQAPVRAAIKIVDTKRLPNWIPNRVHPKSSAEKRLKRLEQE